MIKELTLRQFGDNYTCECGNNSSIDGFHPSNRKGELVDPVDGWDSHYFCGKCSSVIKLKSS